LDDNDTVRRTKGEAKKTDDPFNSKNENRKTLLGKRRLELCSFSLDSRLATDEPPLEYVSSAYET
jgi:hypothetical protein